MSLNGGNISIYLVGVIQFLKSTKPLVRYLLQKTEFSFTAGFRCITSNSVPPPPNKRTYFQTKYAAVCYPLLTCIYYKVSFNI
jgi:hypothetical protein